MNDSEIKKFLTNKFGFDVEDYVIIAKSKDGQDLKYSFNGPALIISGLLSWFNTFVNISAFKTELKEVEYKN